MPAAKLAAFEASLAPVRATDGTVGLRSYLVKVAEWLKAQARSTVDTEEERDALLAGFMALADRLVAPRFGGLWTAVRPYINELLDEQMDILPTLLAAPPVLP